MNPPSPFGQNGERVGERGFDAGKCVENLFSPTPSSGCARKNGSRVRPRFRMFPNRDFDRLNQRRHLADNVLIAVPLNSEWVAEGLYHERIKHRMWM